MAREIPVPPVQEQRNPVIRYVLLAIGWLSVALGVIGIFLPVLPTTPFLLLAAACFMRSSKRFYLWLVNHRQLGPWIVDSRIARSSSAKKSTPGISGTERTWAPAMTAP